MTPRDIGGYGDPHTWQGREPYQDEDEELAIDTQDGSEFEGFDYEE